MALESAPTNAPPADFRNPSDAAVQPGRRRLLGLVALVPAALLLAACSSARPAKDREERPTHKNGRRGNR